jgi:two-component system, chemotaxis family, chemotaxis protein CheY
MRILIVDDSETMRAMIKRVIVIAGVTADNIVEAKDGAAALAILEHDAIDILLTDIHMPVMTGIELLGRVAAEPRWAGLTRVVISSDGSALRRHEVEGFGVRCYVEKPFSPEVMRDVLEEISGPPPMRPS